MLSALFLLAFAIAIVVPWTSADAARSNTYTESQAITEASWAAGRLPAPDARHVREGLSEYVGPVRGSERRLMREGRLDERGWTRLDDLRRHAMAVEPGDEELKEAREGLLGHLGEIAAARRQRAMDARTTPPAGLYAVTIVTGVAVVLLLPFMAGARPRGMTLVPLSLMAALLAAGTYMAIGIAQVFSGAMAVGPDAFTSVQGELHRIAGGG